jgi:hypothetical protein
VILFKLDAALLDVALEVGKSEVALSVCELGSFLQRNVLFGPVVNRGRVV